MRRFDKAYQGVLEQERLEQGRAMSIFAGLDARPLWLRRQGPVYALFRWLELPPPIVQATPKPAIGRILSSGRGIDIVLRTVAHRETPALTTLTAVMKTAMGLQAVTISIYGSDPDASWTTWISKERGELLLALLPDGTRIYGGTGVPASALKTALQNHLVAHPHKEAHGR